MSLWTHLALGPTVVTFQWKLQRVLQSRNILTEDSLIFSNSNLRVKRPADDDLSSVDLQIGDSNEEFESNGVPRTSFKMPAQYVYLND